MKEFDPSGPGVPGKLFGIPTPLDEAEVVILPVPWDVTSSYQAGSAHAPQAILEASSQLDHSIPGIVQPWKLKTAMEDISDAIKEKSLALRPKAEKYIHAIEHGQELSTLRDEINQSCSEIEETVFHQCQDILDRGRMVGCLGGDHSTPLGLIRALSTRHDHFGILQIDAHMDLRASYEGLHHSHASIMRNALTLSEVKSLVQIGIRDYCEEETQFVQSQGSRIVTHFDRVLKHQLFAGKNWSDLTSDMIGTLPEKVYVSFDIDGLDPSLCPHTGTPVPGGLSFDQALYVIEEVVRSGRTIIGFDLCEVCPGNNPWDANVGARVLYQLSILSGISQGKLKFEA